MAAVYERVLDRRLAGSRAVSTEHQGFLCEISPSLGAVPLSGWVRGRVGEAAEGVGAAVLERVSTGWVFRPLRLSVCRVSVKFPLHISMQGVDNTPRFQILEKSLTLLC